MLDPSAPRRRRFRTRATGALAAMVPLVLPLIAPLMALVPVMPFDGVVPIARAQTLSPELLQRLLQPQAPEGGTFDSVPVFVPAATGESRGVESRVVAKSFGFVDANQVGWNVPEGEVIDGGSLPSQARSIAESFGRAPLSESMLAATALHDVATRSRRRPWQQVHELFYHAMLASGVPARQAKLVFAAVYHFGPRWPRRDSWGSVPMTSVSQVVRLATTQSLRGDKASVQVLPGTEVPATCTGCAVGTAPVPARTAEVLVRYTPMPSVIPDAAAFAALRAEIEAKDLSIEEIEEYRPVDVARDGRPVPRAN